MTEKIAARQGHLTQPEASTLIQNKPLIKPNVRLKQLLRFNFEGAALFTHDRLKEVFGDSYRLRFIESNIPMAVATAFMAKKNGYEDQEYILVDVRTIARRTHLPEPKF